MKKCVFVLEDDDSLRELFTILLEEEKYEVKAYPTAKSFTESLALEIPDMVVMDVMLPDGNGVEICAQLKSSEQFRDVPIILMSANHDFNGEKEKCPAEEFIAKPFDINYFIQRVQQYA